MFNLKNALASLEKQQPPVVFTTTTTTITCTMVVLSIWLAEQRLFKIKPHIFCGLLRVNSFRKVVSPSHQTSNSETTDVHAVVVVIVVVAVDATVVVVAAIIVQQLCLLSFCCCCFNVN